MRMVGGEKKRAWRRGPSGEEEILYEWTSSWFAKLTGWALVVPFGFGAREVAIALLAEPRVDGGDVFLLAVLVLFTAGAAFLYAQVWAWRKQFTLGDGGREVAFVTRSLLGERRLARPRDGVTAVSLNYLSPWMRNHYWEASIVVRSPERRGPERILFAFLSGSRRKPPKDAVARIAERLGCPLEIQG